MEGFCLLQPDLDDNTLTRLALLTHSAFSAFNLLAHADPLSPPDFFSCMRRLIHQSTFGHRKSRKVLHDLWRNEQLVFLPVR